MKIRVESRSVWTTPTSALVLFARPGGTIPRTPAPLDRMVRELTRRRGFKGQAGETVVFPTWGAAPADWIIVVGLGEAPVAPWRFERAAAIAARWAHQNKIGNIAFDLAGADEAGEAALARRVMRGAHEGAYDFVPFKTAPGNERPLKEVILHAGREHRKDVLSAARAGQMEGEVLDEIRDLANQPGNRATPVAIADAARRLARRYGLKFRALDRAAMDKAGMNTLLAVAMGSANPPRLIALEHSGNGKGRPLVMIGKTVTFDSGGISIKPSKGMEGMKYDKCGGMAVLAAVVTAARLKLDQPVVAILPAAENLLDGHAQRPGDIVYSMSGQTVEIISTDAEGRLLLADALTWSARFKPAAVVDLATLTGAVVGALGHHASGLMSPDDELSSSLRASGERSGDRLWPLPLWPEYEAGIRSPHADVKNVGDGTAGTIMGGMFLKKFAPAGVPWAHIDLAGSAREEKEAGFRGIGATLFGARLLVDWIEHRKN